MSSPGPHVDPGSAPPHGAYSAASSTQPVLLKPKLNLCSMRAGLTCIAYAIVLEDNVFKFTDYLFRLMEKAKTEAERN